MTAKYKDLKFIEPDSDVYRKIKASELLSLRELEYLSYVVRLEPCTVAEIIKKIGEENQKYSNSKIMGFNKITKPFKELKIIKVSGHHKPPKGRKQEIIALTGTIPKNRKKPKNKKLSAMISSSIESAILAMEIYNKPRVSFRIESYLTLMHIAWTKIMHAYFKKFSGDIYYQKDDKNKIITVNGKKQTWSLSECLKKHGNLSEGTIDNLKLMIELRNMIVHDYIDSSYLEAKVFGQTQAMLNNFEKFLDTYFDGDFKLDLDIAFALQTSREVSADQIKAVKSKLSKEVKSISDYIDKYNSTISEESFMSPEYSFRIALSPFTPNSGRNADVSIVFTDGIDQEGLEQITVLNKYKTVEVKNAGSYLPGDVVKEIKKEIPDFNMNHHSAFFYVFQVRPSGNPKRMTAEVGSKTYKPFCHFDKAVKTFLYTDEWINFIKKNLSDKKITLNSILSNKKKNEYLKPKDYR